MQNLLKTESLRALIRVAQTISSHLELDDVLRAVLSETTRVMGAEAASLILIDDDTGELVFHSATGDKADTLKRFRIPAGSGVVGHVISSRASLVINDAKNDPRFYKQVDEFTGFATRSILCVPMASSDRLWGAIEILNRVDDSPFTDDDEALCEAIASQAAIAIENAHLHLSLVAGERLAAFGTTVAGIAHCIKNVLSAMEGGNHLVHLGIESENLDTVNKGWDIVARNTRFIHDLVFDMLNYAREQSLTIEATDLNDLVRNAVAEVAPALEQQGTRLVFEPGTQVGAAELDRVGIRRSLLNLVTNAGEAVRGKDNATVTVRTSPAGGSDLALSVEDNGDGITPQNLARIFEPFFTTKGSRGTGLGLAVTHKIVNDHGGRLLVDSTPGKGSRMTMVLPRHAAERRLTPSRPRPQAAPPPPPAAPPSATAPEPSPSPTPSETRPGDTPYILIVDDDPDIRCIEAAVLETLGGFSIAEAHNGIEGIRKATSLQPSLIVLDLQMPDKDGCETLQELRSMAETRHIPVIIASGIDSAEVSESTHHEVMRRSGHGPEALLEKPLDPELLLRTARELLGPEC